VTTESDRDDGERRGNERFRAHLRSHCASGDSAEAICIYQMLWTRHCPVTVGIKVDSIDGRDGTASLNNSVMCVISSRRHGRGTGSVVPDGRLWSPVVDGQRVCEVKTARRAGALRSAVEGVAQKNNT